MGCRLVSRSWEHFWTFTPRSIWPDACSICSAAAHALPASEAARGCQPGASVWARPIVLSEGYGKVGVIGAIERKGNIVCRVIGQADARTLAGFVRHAVNDRVKLIATDQNQGYDYFGRGIRHESVNHTQGEYVRGVIHTNSPSSSSALTIATTLTSLRMR